MYRSPSPSRPERLIAIHPLADLRLLLPIALVTSIIAALVLQAGATTVELRITPTPPPAEAPPRPANDLLIPEFDAPHRRWATTTVGDLEVSMGGLVGRSRSESSIYVWPKQVWQIEKKIFTDDGHGTFSVIATDASVGFGDHLPGAVLPDDALLVAGQAETTRALQAWLDGPHTTPFVARYGDPLRSLPRALIVLGAGALILLAFALPRIEVRSTGHPGSFQLRARGLFGTRQLVFNEADAQRIAVRSTPRLGLLWNQLVYRPPGEADVALLPFGMFALQRAVTLRQRLVGAVASAGEMRPAT